MTGDAARMARDLARAMEEPLGGRVEVRSVERLKGGYSRRMWAFEAAVPGEAPSAWILCTDAADGVVGGDSLSRAREAATAAPPAPRRAPRPRHRRLRHRARAVRGAVVRDAAPAGHRRGRPPAARPGDHRPAAGARPTEGRDPGPHPPRPHPGRRPRTRPGSRHHRHGRDPALVAGAGPDTGRRDGHHAIGAHLARGNDADSSVPAVHRARRLPDRQPPLRPQRHHRRARLGDGPPGRPPRRRGLGPAGQLAHRHGPGRRPPRPTTSGSAPTRPPPTDPSTTTICGSGRCSPV